MKTTHIALAFAGVQTFGLLLNLGCARGPSTGQAATDNAEVAVAVVTDVEGCRIYRVHGDGTPYRFVVCRDAQGAVEDTVAREERQHCTTTHTGKTMVTTCTTEEVRTPTVAAPTTPTTTRRGR